MCIFNPSTEKQRQVDLHKFKLAWSTEGVAGWPGLHREPLPGKGRMWAAFQEFECHFCIEAVRSRIVPVLVHGAAEVNTRITLVL